MDEAELDELIEKIDPTFFREDFDPLPHVVNVISGGVVIAGQTTKENLQKQATELRQKQMNMVDDGLFDRVML